MRWLLTAVVVAMALVAVVIIHLNSTHRLYNPPNTMATSTLSLNISAFADGALIPAKYTCDGNQVNPAIEISGVPTEARSLALIMDDPDVPEYVRNDRMWVHWVVFNMSPVDCLIKENTIPSGVLGKGTGGEMSYQGPCPPDREHRYFFKLYALDTKLTLLPGSSKEEVEKAMESHILDQAELMGLYEKNQK